MHKSCDHKGGGGDDWKQCLLLDIYASQNNGRKVLLDVIKHLKEVCLNVGEERGVWHYYNTMLIIAYVHYGDIVRAFAEYSRLNVKNLEVFCLIGRFVLPIVLSYASFVRPHSQESRLTIGRQVSDIRRLLITAYEGINSGDLNTFVHLVKLSELLGDLRYSTNCFCLIVTSMTLDFIHSFDLNILRDRLREVDVSDNQHIENSLLTPFCCDVEYSKKQNTFDRVFYEICLIRFQILSFFVQRDVSLLDDLRFKVNSFTDEQSRLTELNACSLHILPIGMFKPFVEFYPLVLIHLHLLSHSNETMLRETIDDALIEIGSVSTRNEVSTLEDFVNRFSVRMECYSLCIFCLKEILKERQMGRKSKVKALRSAWSEAFREAKRSVLEMRDLSQSLDDVDLVSNYVQLFSLANDFCADMEQFLLNCS
ncbi:hypothetical protein ACOME3_001431 [Neoechinorhynchus agilis]